MSSYNEISLLRIFSAQTINIKKHPRLINKGPCKSNRTFLVRTENNQISQFAWCDDSLLFFCRINFILVVKVMHRQDGSRIL